ncbi:hypothetical protein Gotri_011501 [Gossypium trilobum]|uniref:EF-hand domain-containing protein n=1 Tax=Gossypium trilobum TaxID=34281 RepID=A0A7J9EUI1_9ROSI|nr:hypothetical protein [Gossypium trilobum]
MSLVFGANGAAGHFMAIDRPFVTDDQQFTKSVDERFAALDLNNDGVLSRSELRKAFEFDCDGSGTVDLQEFRSEMKKILLAIADGLGSCPIQMVLEDDDQSFLKKAADLEAAKLDPNHAQAS